MTDLPELTDAEWEAERQKARAEFEAAQIDDSSLFMEEVDGIREILHFDEGEQKFHLERVADVEPVLEWCKGRYNEGLASRFCEFRHVGRYPWVIVQIFAKKWGVKDPWAMLKDKEMVNRLLSDSDLSLFRTLPGNYSRRA